MKLKWLTVILSIILTTTAFANIKAAAGNYIINNSPLTFKTKNPDGCKGVVFPEVIEPNSGISSSNLIKDSQMPKGTSCSTMYYSSVGNFLVTLDYADYDTSISLDTIASPFGVIYSNIVGPNVVVTYTAPPNPPKKN